MSESIVVIGNGPSLREFDFKSLDGVDTLGMNAAYRFWDQVDWYPTHYCCLDSELIATHHKEIKRLVQSKQVKTAFLDGCFLDFFPEAANDNRFVFRDQFNLHWYRKRGEKFGLSFIDSKAFRSTQPTKVTTGAYAVRYAMHLKYEAIGLIGIDLRYVEQIPEAEHTGGLQLVIKKTPEHNPNYFFDTYQKAGDRFQIPNPKSHNFDLHPISFEALRDDIVLHNLNVRVINCNTRSELHTRGIFPHVSLQNFLKKPKLGALVIPTQVKEIDCILNNLKLWKNPAFSPFIHLRDREKPKLILTFSGDRDESVIRRITEEFESGENLGHCFSSLEFLFLKLPKEEDIYIRDYKAPVGKKGYKSGPNQQFFRTILELQNICHYAFFMETDCVPIRPDWLGRLYDLVQTSEEFWIMGSHYRGKSALSRDFARHINGNSVYAVGDSRFIEFVKKWQNVLDETTEKLDRRIAYDCVLEHFFSRGFGLGSSAVTPSLDPSSEAWKIFQETAPYLRYTNYILNCSCKEDLEKNSSLALLDHARENYHDTFIIHNRTICNELQYRSIVSLRSEDTVKAAIQPQQLKVEMPAANFNFSGVLFCGNVQKLDLGFFVTHGEAASNYVAFQYSQRISPGDRVQVKIKILIDKPCCFVAGLYRHGNSSFEGTKKVINSDGELECFEMEMCFLHPHSGVRLQFGSNKGDRLEFALIDATFRKSDQ